MFRFSKLHGAGNDFVFLDLLDEESKIQNPKSKMCELARAMCDRHRGVGADGLIYITRGDKAPFRMTMLNPDGSNGGMCGNGVRCTARLLIENGHQGLHPFDLEVEQRIVHVEPIREDWVRVDMGKAEAIGELCISLEGQEFRGTTVSMGNPHFVVFVDDVNAADLEHVGPKIEHHRAFPNRTNVHFAQALNDHEIKMRTWERGAGITLACGSGACAVGVSGFVTKHCGRNVQIHLLGGTLEIEYREDGTVLMTGPAEHVFDGCWQH